MRNGLIWLRNERTVEWGTYCEIKESRHRTGGGGGKGMAPRGRCVMSGGWIFFFFLMEHSHFLFGELLGEDVSVWLRFVLLIHQHSATAKRSFQNLAPWGLRWKRVWWWSWWQILGWCNNDGYKDYADDGNSDEEEEDADDDDIDDNADKNDDGDKEVDRVAAGKFLSAHSASFSK